MAGSLAIDLSCGYQPLSPGSSQPAPGTSNPAIIRESIGGVGHNIATAAYYCAATPLLFCSAVGDDATGKFATKTLEERGMETKGIATVKASRTARYVAFNNTRKNLAIAMADMEIFHGDQRDSLESWECNLQRARPLWFAIDGNWHPRILRAWIDLARERGSLVAFEPVSVEKSTRIFLMPESARKSHARALGDGAGETSCIVDLAAPNEAELRAMTRDAPKRKAWKLAVETLDAAAIGRSVQEDDQHAVHRCVELIICALHLLPHIPCVAIKMGRDGILWVEILRRRDERLRDFHQDMHVLLRRSAMCLAGGSWSSFLAQLDDEGWFNDFGGVYVRHLRPPAVIRGRDVVDVNGAGDSFLGVLLAGLISGASHNMADLIQIAQEGAAFTLQSHESVSPQIRALAPRIRSLAKA